MATLKNSPMNSTLVAALAACVLSASVLGQTGSTTRVSVSSAGAQGLGDSSAAAAITPDGRYVAYSSYAPNLVAGDTNIHSDIFMRDRQTGTTQRLSLNSIGTQGNDDSWSPSISADGRYVVFMSIATNLVAGDTNGFMDIFLRDRQTGVTTRVSTSLLGSQGNADCFWSTLSADGNFIAFVSSADNLVPGDINLVDDIFVKNRVSGAIERISVDSAGSESDGASYQPAISADGRYLAFWSFATNLVAGDTNGMWDVFVHDTLTGTTERVNLDSSGNEADGDSFACAISADGSHVLFDSTATNLVAGDTNGWTDVFVRDRMTGVTERISVDSSGNQADGDCHASSITADGLHVAFYGLASNLVTGDTNGTSDCFVHDRLTGMTERISVDSTGNESDGDSDYPALSSDGSILAFGSTSTNLVPFDSNQFYDVFVRERLLLHFTSLCDPGSAGVIACPCANPPSGPGRGCNNSSATGGAQLAAAGSSSISNDTLVFTTSGERPTAPSLLLQGTALSANGFVFGQGVRCATGILKRLYTKIASGGSISAPGPGDPSLTTRSAALGDPILSGQSRWYLVYYRDPNVLGGCPATSGFNATQTGRIDWVQ